MGHLSFAKVVGPQDKKSSSKSFLLIIINFDKEKICLNPELKNNSISQGINSPLFLIPHRSKNQIFNFIVECPTKNIKP